MNRLIAAALAALCLAAPALPQTPTIKNSAPVLSQKSGKPAAKTWADWWTQLRGLPDAKPVVGDVAEPELGKNFDKLLAPIASNFDTAPLLVPTGGTGVLPQSGAAERVGAFRFMCNGGQIIRDDPIVWPNQPGKSHLHQFFGNLGANAYSTYGSLRTTGDSTCVNNLIRSAYWQPAMLDGRGNVVVLDYVSVYYKREPENDPACRTTADRCVAMPAGMRFVFGYDMVTGKPSTGAMFYKCVDNRNEYGVFRDLTSVAAVCKPGMWISVTIASPTCWNEKQLDSKNHRDHVAYADFGDTGVLRCPATHRAKLPQFSLQAFYRIEATDNPSLWSLSSDDMTGMGMGKAKPGTTFHADFFEAEDEPMKSIWIKHCINLMLSCNAGDLGNGQQLKEVWKLKWKPEPHLIPIPAA